jgi:hypothetical protein
MRFYSNVGPYSGRQPKAKEPKAGNQLLRQSSKQPDGKLPKTAKGGIGDVKDTYLTGRAGGEAYEFYDRRRGKR